MFVQFFQFGFIYALCLVVAKLLYLDILANDQMLVKIVYLLFCFFVSIATIRRVGEINYLECFLVMGCFAFFGIIADILITANITGVKVYLTPFLWLCYPVSFVGQFFFHKKIHMKHKKNRLGDRYNPKKLKFF